MTISVTLSIKGEAKKVNIQEELTIETIQKFFKKKDEPDMICCYETDDKFIFIFGYQKGKKGTENKTELPEPYSSTVLYDDWFGYLLIKKLLTIYDTVSCGGLTYTLFAIS